MKVLLDIGTDGPVKKAIEQVFTTVGELEFVSTIQEADAIMASDPEKAERYVRITNKRVAQLLWWNQKASALPQSDRFQVFDAFSKGSLPGLIEAMKFLKGE